MTLENLVERLNYHRELYYKGFVDNAPAWLDGEPPISDDEFDDLVEEIKKLDPQNPAIVSVGSVSGGDVVHTNRMGSLAKVKVFDDLRAWIKTYASESKIVWVLPKYDGLSLKSVYKKGDFNLAATRGNGEVGENVSTNASRIRGVLPKAGDKNLEVRGEVVMLRSVFNALNEAEIAKGFEPFKNPRNAASGSLKNGDPNVCEQRKLDFFAYDVAEGIDGFKNYGQVLDFLNRLGFNTGTAYSFEINAKGLEALEAYLTHFGKNRNSLDYATDGAVIILDSLEDQKKAGWSSDMHHPNGKIAFKFEPEQKVTKISGIRYQVGKTGKIVPVAELEPVDLDGSMVSNVTLHNIANVTNNGLGVGAEIVVVKANDIIPYVKHVIKRSDKTELPSHCPCCDTLVRYDAVNGWCDNNDCNARLEAKILHFLKTVECLGIGEKTVQALIRAGLVKNLKDLFSNEMSIENIAYALGNSDPNAREAEIVFNAIHAVKDLSFSTFIESLGIQHVGKGTSRKLAGEFETPDRFISEIDYENLIKMDDIGEKTATSICESVKNRRDEILELARKIGIKQKVLSSNTLSGKSFLFTGTLSKPRKQFEEMVLSNGGSLNGSVSKTLDYLVVGEDAGSKLAKAQKLGVKTLTEIEFLNLVG